MYRVSYRGGGWGGGTLCHNYLNSVLKYVMKSTNTNGCTDVHIHWLYELTFPLLSKKSCMKP